MIRIHIPDDLVVLQREIDECGEKLRKLSELKREKERKLYDRASYFADTITVEFVDENGAVNHPPTNGVSVEIMLLGISERARSGKKI